MLSLQEAESFYDEEADPKGEISLGVDVARFGEDESVIAIWKGNTLIGIEVFEKESTMQVRRHVKRRAIALSAKVIVVDEIGVGGGVVDGLSEDFESKNWIQVVPFNAARKANDSQNFENSKSEVWWLFAKDVKEKRCRSAIQDDKLEGQISGFLKIFTKSERIRVEWPETKEKGKIDKSPSPDRADATIMGWLGTRFIFREREDRQSEQKKQDDYEEPMLTAGIRERDF